MAARRRGFDSRETIDLESADRALDQVLLATMTGTRGRQLGRPRGQRGLDGPVWYPCRPCRTRVPVPSGR